MIRKGDTKIAIIGAGNMATQLCYSFNEARHPVWQIVARSPERANHLKPLVTDSIVSKYSAIDPSVDIILISVNDIAISTVAQELSSITFHHRPIIAHTAGNAPLSNISDYYNGPCGVFYPLQSVRKERPIALTETPILINGADESTIQSLLQLGSLISDKSNHCTDEIRKGLHLPAVMVNNFVNYLYYSAYQYCEKHDLPYEHLNALIQETANRIVCGEQPESVQTGPAVRRDYTTMARHESSLQDMPDQLELYQHISNLIMKMP